MTSFQARSFSQAMQVLSITCETLNLQNDHPSLFRFLYIQKGGGWLTTKSTKQQIQENCLLWLCPEEDWQMHLNPNTKGYHFILPDVLQCFLNYDPQLIYHPQFLQLSTTSGAIHIDCDTSSLFDMLFKTMADELKCRCPFELEILQRYSQIFMLHLLRKLECVALIKTEAAQADIVQRFQSVLEKNFKTKKQVGDYAAELFLSPNYLNAIIRKLTGRPVSYHIKQRIVLEAKRRGAYTDMCMKQVAYELGFDDIPHFSKYFKSATGMNFTDFKQETYLLPMAG